VRHKAAIARVKVESTSAMNGAEFLVSALGAWALIWWAKTRRQKTLKTPIAPQFLAALHTKATGLKIAPVHTRACDSNCCGVVRFLDRRAGLGTAFRQIA
jgi:hypothetical protein